jgi:hypothetical protein
MGADFGFDGRQFIVMYRFIVDQGSALATVVSQITRDRLEIFAIVVYDDTTHSLGRESPCQCNVFALGSRNGTLYRWRIEICQKGYNGKKKSE